MPSKPISASWLELIQRVALSGETFSLPVETRSKAIQLRAHFYAARRALEKDPERAELFAAALAIRATVSPSGETWSVLFEPIEGSWDSLLVGAALRGEQK